MKGLIAGALALSITVTSCLGPNEVFNDVHEWNKGVSENRWVQEGVHLGCWIVPVYQLSLFLDIVVFNSIEWWKKD